MALLMDQAFSRKLSQAVKLEIINMITRVLLCLSLRCDQVLIFSGTVNASSY